MKNSFLTLLLMVFCSASLLAVSPAESAVSLKDRLNTGSDLIEAELSQLTQMNEAILAEGMDYDELQALYPEMVSSANLSAAAAPGIFTGHPDVPVGIPGFWWGFCLSLVGTLIVYLVMDEGEGRKEQVRNSIYGCLIFQALYWVLTIVLSI